MYRKGAGVYRDTAQATSYTRLACERGYTEACPKPVQAATPAQGTT